jgi:hypothetical protein
MKTITLSIGLWLATISIALVIQGDVKSAIWLDVASALALFVAFVEGGDDKPLEP